MFVAGQAGSGKTLVVDLVHAALERRGGAVRVDRDAYKNIHPHYAALLSEDVRTAGVRVRSETYRWQVEVEARVRAGRYDAVVEAPLAHPQEFLAGMAAYRQAGYRRRPAPDRSPTARGLDAGGPPRHRTRRCPGRAGPTHRPAAPGASRGRLPPALRRGTPLDLR
ncbi:zeta toxin family protein [Streptomyces scabiei]|uniref:zeta toxin family protein n=1 Tax=Streptomyces scabiei TaxID=1930 RepID=UPI0029AB9BC2|nr:zeta toxin family protein [Streptomyces scabiei]MDX2576731.1 zeta toxin family protein [Streptomyces scabiei]MDX3029688.1 zeta toxin family protein [Streptomyces scabiei]MDX3204896.1 zeta toxin family protein [Streptomyces scabiei]